MRRLVKTLRAKYPGILVLELSGSDTYVYPYSEECPSCPNCDEACNKDGEDISASVSASWSSDIANNA